MKILAVFKRIKLITLLTITYFQLFTQLSSQAAPVTQPAQPIKPVTAAPNPAITEDKAALIDPFAEPTENPAELSLGIPEKTNVPKKSPQKEEANIFLNFENVSLSNVINYIADLDNMNTLPNKDLEAQKVSLTTHQPISLIAAKKILLTLCEVCNFRMIEVGDIYRFIPTAYSNQEPLPAYLGIEPENLPDSDLAIRFVYLFKNIKAEAVKTILDQMLIANSVQFNSDLNACIITEKCLAIKAAMKIVKELDIGGLRESIQIVKLKEANAEDVERLFREELLGGDQKQQRFNPIGHKKEVSFFSKTTKIIAEPRNNTLILLGMENNLNRIKRFIARYIDIPLKAPASRLHIKELKYILAEGIAPILKAITEPPIKDLKTPLQGKVKYFEDMVIAAETNEEGEGESVVSVGSGNRLLIACNQDDWKRIEDFIEKLDKPKPQVAMEVLFVDYDITRTKELSAEMHSKKDGTLGTNVRGATFNIQQAVPNTDIGGNNLDITRENLANIPATVTQAAVNASWLTMGRASVQALPATQNGLWFIAKSLLRVDHLNIIEQPFIVATNRSTGKLNIATTMIVAGEVEANNVTPVQQTEKIKANVTVELTPGINSDGVVNLQIKISLDEFSNIETNGVPDLTSRSVLTRASVLDGEVLVIGGLVQNIVQEVEYKTPILADIPFIGNLFKGRQKTSEKRDLYIFIRTSIIKPQFEGKPSDYTQLKLDYAKSTLGQSSDVVVTNDPIQRWYFDSDTGKPDTTLTGAEKQIEFELIKNFTLAKYLPRTVKMDEDPYYKPSESRKIRTREKIKEDLREKLKKRKAAVKKEAIKLKEKEKIDITKTKNA